jgi:hypothetical protein
MRKRMWHTLGRVSVAILIISSTIPVQGLILSAEPIRPSAKGDSCSLTIDNGPDKIPTKEPGTCSDDACTICCSVFDATKCQQMPNPSLGIQQMRPNKGGVMRRGVEGEQPETSTGDSTTPASKSK